MTHGAAGFRVRVPAPDEAEAIARVRNITWRATYGHLLPASFYDHHAFEQNTALWRSILGRPPQTLRVRVAEIEGGIVGFASAGDPIGDDAPVRALQLHTLYVLPEHHGCGAGQALFDAVVGAEPAQLWVAEDNPRAHTFYRRNGFRPDGAETVLPGTTLVEVRLVR